MLFRNFKLSGIAFVLMAVLVFSGCSIDKAGKGKRLAPEVLIAQECGMDKLPCCQDEPACSYSQKCCVDPNSPTRNYCSDQCSCGAKGEFCCAGEIKCGKDLACVNGNCAECGLDAQACCDGGRCGKDLVCNNGKCTQCGVEGNVCCANGICLNQDKNDQTRTECSDGKCVQCGSGGGACAGGTKCIPGNLYNNGACFQCGEANQPCCGEDSGKSYDCNPKKYLSCYQGFCLE